MLNRLKIEPYDHNTRTDPAERMKKTVDQHAKQSVKALSGYHKPGFALFGIVLALWAVGCGSGPDDAADRRGQGEVLFGGGGGGGSGNPQDLASWSIGLATMSGPDRIAAANDAAERFRAASRVLADAFVINRGDRAVVLLGEFASPSSEEAVELLEDVRSVRIEGEKPFATAFFVPPRAGEVGDLDLRTARDQFGADCTLQVGAYGRIDRGNPTEKEVAEFRAKAEQAARELRAQGEQAFYYHGPSMSMVTVGALRYEDLEASPGLLRLLQERFPHNLLNGQGIREKIRTDTGEEWRLQPSMLVGIPD